MTLTGTFRTENASKYLQQLCKHFAHKVAVEYSTHDGRAQMPVGPLHLVAHPDALTATFELDQPESSERAKGILDSHLERFAFREGFTSMEWTSTQ